MRINIFYIFVLLISAFSIQLSAQTLSPAIVVDGAAPRACIDRSPGGVVIDRFIGSSNDVSLPRSFFCFGDEFQLFNDGTGNFSESDPNPATPSGVGYAWYSCTPTVTGDMMSDILADPCILDDPDPAPNPLWIYVDEANGDAVFRNLNLINGQSIPDFFNNGEPLELFFAPITVDAINANNQAVFESGPNPSCVKVNPAAAFSIVYLKPIRAVKGTLRTNGNGDCVASFRVIGGLPQFDNSTFYSFNIYNTENPTITATVTGNYGHNDVVEFVVPVSGDYTIEVSDDKACPYTLQYDNLACDGVTFCMEQNSGPTGSTICLNLTVTDFNNVAAGQFELNWDPSILSYQPGSYTYDFGGASVSPLQNEMVMGRFSTIWVENGANDFNLVDGHTMITLCFDVIGDPGQVSPFYITSEGALISNSNSDDIAIQLKDGSFLVEFPTGLGANFYVCPDDGNEGSLTIVPYGGSSPYSIVVTNTLTSVEVTNYTETNEGGSTTTSLPAGTYTIMVTDDTGASFNRNINISNGTLFTIDETIKNPDCSNTSDGEIQLDVQPISGIYTYEWSDQTFGDEKNTLPNGSYTVTVTDQFGCEQSKNYTIYTQELFLVDFQTANATCEFSSDGSATTFVKGGTPLPVPTSPGLFGYRVTWLGQIPIINDQFGSFQSNEFEPSLQSVTVEDDNGCRHTHQFQIDFDHEVALTNPVIDDPLECFGDEGARIRFTAETNDRPSSDSYLYFWDSNDVGGTSSSSNEFTSDSLLAGTYCVTVVNVDLSPNPVTTMECRLDTCIVIEPANPEITVELIDARDETCSPGNDGLLEVRAMGGTTTMLNPFIYDWIGETNNSVLTGIDSGRYDITIYDAEQCTVDTFFEIGKELGPRINGFLQTPVTCGQTASDGQIIVFYNDQGNDNITVDWRDDQNNSYSGDTISNLSSGTYYISVSAGPACVARDTVVLLPADEIVLDNVAYTLPTCPLTPDGTIVVMASNTANDLTYEWDHVNNTGTNTLANVQSGVYTVTITSPSSSCPPLVIDTITLPKPVIFSANFTGVNAAQCLGQCTGTATVNITGATGTINYLWSDNTINNNSNTLCPGDQYVIVTDDICSDSFSVNIPAGAEVLVSNNPTPTSCFGDNDGSITVGATGGLAPYNFSWNILPNGDTHNNLIAGTYYVTASDVNGCEGLDTVIVTQPDSLVAFADPQDVMGISCAGRDDASISISVLGGNTGNQLFAWRPAVSVDNTAANLSPGSYGVTMTDSEGCIDSVRVDIADSEGLLYSLNNIEPIDCFGNTTSLSLDTVYAGSGAPYSLVINGGLPQDVDDVVLLRAGTHTITIFDQSGCSRDTTIEILQPDEIVVDLGPDQTVDLGDSARLSPILLQSTLPIDTTIWFSDPLNLSCYDCPAPWIIPGTTTTVSITVIDENGCSSRDDMTVFVDASRNVFIPTAFSPNGDNINDVFEVYTGKGVQEISQILVFDRWGDKLFETIDLPPSTSGTGGWDGTFQGKDMLPGVYVYAVSVEFIDGRVITYRGEVTLID